MLLAALCLGTISFAQAQQQAEPQKEDEYTFSSNVDQVVLPVTVVDHKGELVSDLSKQDFSVYDDGRPQEIRFFSRRDIPVTVGLVIDDSGSMRPKRTQTMLAALNFVRLSNPQDQVFVVNFNEKVSLGLPPGTPFSNDTEKLREAFLLAPAAGKTALYDAVAVGLDHLAQGTRDKKALLVVSDGGDNASRHSFKQVLVLAQKSNAIIYTIGLFDEQDQDQKPGVLKKLAKSTGGESYFPQKTTEITGECAHIARDLRNQYTIAYTPSNPRHDGAFHSIKVIAKVLRHRKLFVRTRPGYYAPSGQTAADGNGRSR